MDDHSTSETDEYSGLQEENISGEGIQEIQLTDRRLDVDSHPDIQHADPLSSQISDIDGTAMDIGEIRMLDSQLTLANGHPFTFQLNIVPNTDISSQGNVALISNRGYLGQLNFVSPDVVSSEQQITEDKITNRDNTAAVHSFIEFVGLQDGQVQIELPSSYHNKIENEKQVEIVLPPSQQHRLGQDGDEEALTDGQLEVALSPNPRENVVEKPNLPKGGTLVEIPLQQQQKTELEREDIFDENDKPSQSYEELGGIVHNVCLTTPSSGGQSEVKGVQLWIPDHLKSMLNPNGKQVTEKSASVQKVKQENTHFVSLLSSKSISNVKESREETSAERPCTEFGHQKCSPPSQNILASSDERERSISFVDKGSVTESDTGNRRQLYKSLLDQITSHETTVMGLIEACQGQDAVIMKTFCEKLQHILKMCNDIRSLLDCEEPLTCDRATQTLSETVDSSTMCDISPPFFSAVSGRRIRQPGRYQTSFTDTSDIPEEFSDQKPVVTKSWRKKPYSSKYQIKMKDDSTYKSHLLKCIKPEPKEVNVQETNGHSHPESADTTTNDQLKDDVKDNEAQITTEAGFKENEKVAEEGKTEDKEEIMETEPVNDSLLGFQDGSVKRKKSTKTKKDYESEARYKFFCQMCSFKSKRESHFCKHLQLHDKITEIFSCKLCDFKTIRNSTLRKHEVTHSSNLIKCKECAYTTDSEKLLTRHVKLKHSKKPRMEKRREKSLAYCYTCTHCGHKTASLIKFKIHLKSHAAEVNTEEICYECDQCPYKTKRKEHYSRHKSNVHSDHRPHLCDTCGRSFKRSDTLTQHKQVHLEKLQRQLKFICQTCSKGFRSQAHLSEHMAMHSNNRQYLCDVCGASFKTKSCQQKHIKNIHQNPRSFPCTICEKRFNTNYALKRHERTHEHDLCIQTAPPTNVFVTQSYLSDVTNPGLSQSELVQTQDIIITPGIDESYEQANDKLQQVLSENASAIMYLSSSLQASWT